MSDVRARAAALERAAISRRVHPRSSTPARRVPRSGRAACRSRDRGRGEQVVAEAIAAVEVERRGAEAGEDEAARFVDGQAAPCVRAAAIAPAVAFPRL